MIRIYTWPEVQTAINPCLRLFYRALEPWQVRVTGRIPLDNDVLRKNAADVDVLHFHWGPDLLWRNRGPGFFRRVHGLVGVARLLGLARHLGKRIVWSIHDLESHDGSDFLDRRGYRLLASRADLCICHDDDAYRKSIAKLGCRPEKLLVTPLCNFDGAYPDPIDRRATLTALGLDPDRRTLLCFGLARPYKGYDLAIAALQSLPANFQLVVAGGVLDPAYEQTLRSAAARDNRVRLVLREISDQESVDLVHACDCVVLPYRRITGSGVFLLAGTLARGVVASDLPYFRAALALEPDAGTLFETGNAADLAAAVDRYFATPQSLRNAAARRLADRHTPDIVVRPFAAWLHKNLPERVEKSGTQLSTEAPSRSGVA
jgi:glycosyltransferase involved in cell wall biosynthesis